MWVDELGVLEAPEGARVEVSCRGARCPFKRRSAAVNAKGTANLAKFFKRKFRPKLTIDVAVTYPGWIGRVGRFAVKTADVPDMQRLCLPPGVANRSAADAGLAVDAPRDENERDAVRAVVYEGFGEPIALAEVEDAARPAAEHGDGEQACMRPACAAATGTAGWGTTPTSRASRTCRGTSSRAPSRRSAATSGGCGRATA